MAHNSNPQTSKFSLILGALGYVSRPDITATPPGYLVSGSQNVLINESDIEGTDKVETRGGSVLLGAASTDRNGARNEFTFKTKAGYSHMLRFLKNGDLELYLNGVWELLKDSLDGDYPCRFATVWDATELIKRMLFVNHNATLYSWSGAVGTLASVTTTKINLNENIGTQGFLANGTRSIRIRDTGGVWRETAYTAESGTEFTVSTDLTSYTFDDDAPVLQVVGSSASTPASGFINDCITSVENHVFLGSNTSPVVYMSKSTSFTDFTFSDPRLATEGWQFQLDDFLIGFEKDIASDGRESVVFFAGNDWIYRVQFIDIGDTTIAQIASTRPIVVSSGQGAVSQDMIGKLRNSIIYLNKFNELVELGNFENVNQIQAVPISDPIKPDFVAADFTGGCIKFIKNNLYVVAPPSGRMFIFSLRQNLVSGERRFWQPPQLFPVSQISDYAGGIIGHNSGVSESYTLFSGTNDNGKLISFKAHFSYLNNGAREKLKDFDKYFVELYITSNTTVYLKLIFEYLGAKKVLSYPFRGTERKFLFTPDAEASLGVSSLGVNPLGGIVDVPENFLKYRRFKKVTPVTYFEMQTRFEAEDIDAQFQVLCHGSNAELSKISPAIYVD